MNENSQISYFNTLIFTIVSGIISLVLLVLLLSKGGKKLMYLIITVEVGILSVIVVCIVQIIMNEKRLDKLRKNRPKHLTFDKCPDYYVKTDSNNTSRCENHFEITDANMRKFVMRIYPETETNIPTTITDFSAGTGVFNSFQLDALEKDKKDAQDECDILSKEPTDGTTTYAGYSKLPWTHAMAKCGGFV